jgi:hypothetical protein
VGKGERGEIRWKGKRQEGSERKEVCRWGEDERRGEVRRIRAPIFLTSLRSCKRYMLNDYAFTIISA